LTGIGVPDLAFSATALQFGSHDLGSSTTMTVTATNSASGTVVLPLIATTGDYASSTTCGSTLANGASCTIGVTFTPTTTGDRPGTLTIGANPPIALDGNGVDFSMALLPNSGTVESGLSLKASLTDTPIAGFNAGVTQSCTTNAPGATCLYTQSLALASAQTTGVSIATTSEYAVIGYGGFGPFWIVGAGTGLLLLIGRRGRGRRLRAGLLMLVLASLGAGLSGCSGKLPAKNAVYTPAGSYTVTLTATDGFLTHSVSYALTVTAP
jgi:hypothetical protein